MIENKPVYIISDTPVRDSDLFGFDAYAKTIAELIASKENKTPFVIGIFGPWGSGKTTLMQTVINRLEDIEKYEKHEKKKLFRNCKTVWFQAWKYKDEEEILAALIEEIFKTMKRDGFFEGCKAEIESFLNTFDKSKVIGKITEFFTGGLVDVSEFFSKLEYKEKLGFYDTFQDFFDRLLWTYLTWRPKIKSVEKPDDTKAALAIFIDDLDRCPKDRILRVLETIKLFMDKRGCVFIIGAANDIIENALKETYGEGASKFLDKVVQVTFNLPKIRETEFSKYVEKISPDVKDAVVPHLPVIITSLEHNPRRFKRFLNNLNLQEGLLKNKGIDVTFDHLLYWNIIDYAYPLLRDDIKDNPQTLFTLKEKIEEIDSKIVDARAWEISEDLLKSIPHSLHSHIKKRQLVDMVRKFDIPIKQLNELVTFTEIVESPEELREKMEYAKVAITSDNLENMVEVPSGKFLYGDEKREESIERSFRIDIYPVTNTQYEKFIHAGGYTKQEILQGFWSEEGRKWRVENNITQPRYWEDAKWNQPDHPVVGVSYYEAEAYAKWAGKRLPTEKEWEKAARGTNGREYPWGNDFDKDKCNTIESGIGATSRVTRYPNGVSPYGCYDMAGNVWEWTDSWYEEGTYRVLRGGSWSGVRDGARCAGRGRSDPGPGDIGLGFRCVRTI